MRWTRWIAAGSCLAAAAAAVFVPSCAPYAAREQGLSLEQKITRGEYLSHICGCNDCHTPGFFYGAPDMDRKLSGSELGWQGPWGVSYASNLTPDPATGIGDWTEEQIVTAIRTGHRPDGSLLLPPMPWTSFSRLTDEDAYAIAAYLKSLPAIEHENPARIPPGGAATGPTVTLPPPPAWDAPPPESPPGD